MSSPNASTSPARFLRELGRLLPDGAVLTEAEALPFGTDKWFASGTPLAAVFPTTTAQVSKVLRLANKNRVPVTARGAGFGYVGGCVPVQGGILLSLERMNRILEIHQGDFVAVVEPGVITGKLQEAVRGKGLFYPPDPASLKDCSIGGNIATNAGGPRCLKYGVTRQYVLGLEVVLMDGRVLQLGGRTHKNKTGFDLVGLFTGSEGLLGVVTQATLKLLPLPPSRGVISAGFSGIREAAAAVQSVFAGGFLPAALEVADGFTLNAARNYEGNVAIPSGEAHVLLELDGQKASVLSELKAVEKILLNAGAHACSVARDETSCEELWGIRRTFSLALKSTGLRKLNEDIVVPRGRLVDLMAFTNRLQKKCGFPIACFGHAGDGNIHVNIMVGDWDDKIIRQRAGVALDELFAQVLAWGGAITGEHGIGLAKKRWWKQALSQPVRAVHRQLKESLDPHGLLNPGKFV